jgi:hypothetical protein
MAAQRLSRRHKHLLHGWRRTNQRTRGMIPSSHQDRVHAWPGDKGNMSHRVQTLEPQGLMVIGRSPGGKAASLWLTPEGQKWAAQRTGHCDEGETDVAARGCRAGHSLYIAPAPLCRRLFENGSKSAKQGAECELEHVHGKGCCQGSAMTAKPLPGSALLPCMSRRLLHSVTTTRHKEFSITHPARKVRKYGNRNAVSRV